jgi:hypothetical protein
MDSDGTSGVAVENSAKHAGRMPKLPRVLIEDWPPAAIGVECTSERATGVEV